MQAQIRKTRWGKNLLLGVGLLALLLLLAPAGAGAVDLVVDNGATKIVPPSIAYDNETIGGTGQGTLLQFSGSNTVNNDLTLGDQSTGKGTYQLFSGDLEVGGVGGIEIIGKSGTGSFNQYGGSHTVTDILAIGSQDHGSGSYQLFNGRLEAVAESIGIENGIGSFKQFGGTAVNERLILGLLNGRGTYQLFGGSLSGGDELIGDDGTGVFSQIGGSHLVADTLALGTGMGSGTYTLTSGNLSVGVDEMIGDEGTGSFTHTSGNHTVNGNLTLGNTSTDSGTYNLTSGSLMVGGNETIGNSGIGVFAQTSGSHTVVGDLRLGVNGSGTYNLNSGNLHAANEVVGFGGNGSFTQGSGNNIVDSTLTLGELDTASGTYNLKSGSLSAAFERIGDGGTGVVNQSGGNHTVANTLNIGLHGNGTYNLTGGALSVAQEEVGGDGTGTFTQSGGKHTVAGFLVVSGVGDTGSGTYNLQGGQLTAGTISINGPFGPAGGNGHFNVMNTVTTVTGDVVNEGTVKTTNATVTWNGNFTNDGAYISDPSKQTFNKDLEVGRFGYIVGLTSQDLFIVKNDFLNNSIQDGLWNTAQAGLKFITGTDTSHTFAIAGDGSTAGHPFAWYSLNITGQTLHLQDGDATADGAQWLEALIGAKFTGTTLTNIINDDPDNVLDLYYEKNLAINAYLGGLNYTITGGAGGMLMAHTPLPPSVFLLGSGLLGLGLLGWRRKRLTS